MEYTTKLVYQSNYWYNDGLQKAKIRDLSGAVKSLRKSLQYNQANIAARNLLGLVYYGRGDVIEALVEWILSKNIQSHDNIANYYISKVQEVPGELETINQAVKRFNQSLDYARQNGEDLAIIQLKKVVAAHPTYVKAYQLLPSSISIRSSTAAPAPCCGRPTRWIRRMRSPCGICTNSTRSASPGR